MKTKAEIVSELRELSKKPHGDFFGVKSNTYLECLTFENAREFLKPETTASDWEGLQKLLTDDNVKSAMLKYMSFAWEKANRCRGLSASRSMDHYEAWLFILGDDEATRRFEAVEYEHYGKEKLIALCEYFGWDHKQWDDGVRTNG